MPFCSSCGDVFEGRGTFCIYHNPYTFSKSHDTGNFPLVKYRTVGQSGRHKSHKSKDYDDMKHYDQTYDQNYDQNDLSVVPYQQTFNQNFNSTYPYGSQVSSSQLASVAAQTFTRLTSQHAINSMTFSTSPSGMKSVAVTANKEREQCGICRKWFPDHRRLELHHWEHTSGCEVHGICFGKEEEYYHGTSWRHDRCFVKGCGSVYRKEGGWKGSVIEAHIRESHP